MSYLRTEGIVLKEINTGEADKIIVVFTKRNGKLRCIANGARRPKSILASGTSFLCYSDFVLFKSKDLYKVNSCEIIETFYPIRTDLIKLTYASHIVEIVNDVIQENQPAVSLLKLFLNTLHFLANTDRDPKLLTRIFEMRLMCSIGYKPYLKACINCGNQELNEKYFSFSRGGILCEKCKKTDEEFSMLISQELYSAILYIINSELKKIFSLKLSDTVLDEFSKFNKRYLKKMLEKEYRKDEFINYLI